MTNWPKLTLVKDIQVFIGFANFYQCFIQGFCRIAVLLISQLKATGLSYLVPKAFKADNNEVVRIGDRANRTVVNSSKNEKSRNSTCVPNIGAIEESNFLTPNAKKAFNHLRVAFIKAPILRHFNLGSHIQIKTNTSGYAIGGVLSQLHLDIDRPLNNSSDFC